MFFLGAQSKKLLRHMLQYKQSGSLFNIDRVSHFPKTKHTLNYFAGLKPEIGEMKYGSESRYLPF